MAMHQVLLIYDKQCPVCDYYCRHIRIKETAGELLLIEAREPSEIMREITAAGLDIDQGMVLKLGEGMYYGSDAIHVLALINSKSGLFNRVNAYLFRSKTLSLVFYPILRFFRNLLLKLLRRTKVNNLNLKGNERF